MTKQFKNTSVNDLSLGQRQRTAIERALYYDPDIILCDEPTASLDPDNAESIKDVEAAFSFFSCIICIP